MILSSTLPHFTLVLVSSDIQRVLEFPVFFSLVLPLSSLSWDTSRLEPNPAKGSREQLIKLLQRECTGLEQKDCEGTRPVRHEIWILLSVKDWTPLNIVPTISSYSLAL